MKEGLTYDKVYLEVRLAGGTKGVNSAVLGFVLAVLFGLLEPFISTRESNELQETAAVDASLVLLIGCDCAVLLWPSSQQVTVETVAILDLEYMRQDGMVEQVLTNVLRVNEELDAMRLEISLATNTRQHEQLGTFIGTLRHDYLVLRSEGIVLPIRTDDSDTNCFVAFELENLGSCGGHNSDVLLPFHKDGGVRSLALVDGVDALEEPLLSAGVDIGSQFATFADPCCLKSVSERLHLGDHIRMCDMQRPSLVADLGEFCGVQVVIVMVSGRLVKIVLRILPIPFFGCILGPIVDRCSTASNPGIVVLGAGSTQDLASWVGLLYPSVVRTVDHGGLVLPVPLAAAKLESTSGSVDLWNLSSFAVIVSEGTQRARMCHHTLCQPQSQGLRLWDSRLGG